MLKPAKKVTKTIKEDTAAVPALDPANNKELGALESGKIKAEVEGMGAADAKDQQGLRQIDDTQEDNKNGVGTEALAKFDVAESIYTELLSLSEVDLKARQESIKEAIKGSKAAVQISESTKAILETIKTAEGVTELPESFKVAVEETVNAKVTAKLNAERAHIVEHTKNTIKAAQTKLNETLIQKTKESTSFMVEKIDSYLDEVVATWLKENKLNVEKGVRTQILENFYRNSVRAIKESGIEADTSPNAVAKFKTLEESVKTTTAENEQLKAQLNEARAQSLAERRKANALVQASLFESETKGLSQIQKEKVKKLAEGVSYKTLGDFSKKLKELTETVKAEGSKRPVVKEDIQSITETVIKQEPAKVIVEQVDPFAMYGRNPLKL